ncbi:50S ribosomal protein L10 [candidate division WOR-3 bacterium]|nr:50S ribosomal protein L10 [candidate division WOR-3 bacterium]
MNKQEKKKFVEKLAKDMSEAKAVYLADYKGIKVNDDVRLRRELREAGVSYRVVKNSLLKRAFEKNKVEVPEEYFAESTAVAFAKEDPVSPAKIISKFLKDVGKPEFKMAYLDGTIFGAAEVEQIAKLPSKEELLSKLVWVLQSPISGFASTLNEVLAKFVRVMDAVKQEKEKIS